MVNASASKYSTTHSACLAFYVAQVSDFVSQLSRVTFYGFVFRSVSGCLEPENKIYRAVFSPTNWMNYKYLQSSSAPVLFPLKLKGIVYLQAKAETDWEAKSFSPYSNKNSCQKLTGQFVCVLPCFLSPFRTCEGIGLVSLLSVTWGTLVFLVRLFASCLSPQPQLSVSAAGGGSTGAVAELPGVLRALPRAAVVVLGSLSHRREDACPRSLLSSPTPSQHCSSERHSIYHLGGVIFLTDSTVVSGSGMDDVAVTVLWWRPRVLPSLGSVSGQFLF